jgi:hypothetical protein
MFISNDLQRQRDQFDTALQAWQMGGEQGPKPRLEDFKKSNGTTQEDEGAPASLAPGNGQENIHGGNGHDHAPANGKTHLQHDVAPSGETIESIIAKMKAGVRDIPQSKPAGAEVDPQTTDPKYVEIKTNVPPPREAVTIDWSKVRPDWKVADLPDDEVPETARIILNHAGSIKDLKEEVGDQGLPTKNLSRWEDIPKTLATSLQRAGYAPEKIAEILLADLPCNQGLAKHTDRRPAVEKIVRRVFEAETPRSDNSPLPSSTWPDGVFRDTGRPKLGIENTVVAIKRLGLTNSWDEFRQKEYWTGHRQKNFNGEVSDEAITVTRREINKRYGFYPSKEMTNEAITCLCRDNSHDPVRTYFDNVKQVAGVQPDMLLIKYLGADDTPLNRAIGRKIMCALVRRAKQPGCKFDHQLVLQAAQGFMKSTFCECLAVYPDLYTDAGDLSGTIKEQVDITLGKQVIEFPELSGFGRATRERNKASLSRKVDRARLSYARRATDHPRRSISISTTNEGHYLNDPTGERRYWHVVVRFFKREDFFRDKDALYAAAVALEPTENLWLDTPELAAAHDVITRAAKEPNEMVDLLSDLEGEVWALPKGQYEERVSSTTVRNHLHIKPEDACRMQGLGRRILDAMMHRGWAKATKNIRCYSQGGKVASGYFRPVSAEEAKRRAKEQETAKKAAEVNLPFIAEAKALAAKHEAAQAAQKAQDARDIAKHTKAEAIAQLEAQLRELKGK